MNTDDDQPMSEPTHLDPNGEPFVCNCPLHAAAESQREALDVDDLALALELVAPIDWASFGEYLRFTEEAKKSAYRQIAQRVAAKYAALKEQPSREPGEEG